MRWIETELTTQARRIDGYARALVWSETPGGQAARFMLGVPAEPARAPQLLGSTPEEARDALLRLAAPESVFWTEP